MATKCEFPSSSNNDPKRGYRKATQFTWVKLSAWRTALFYCLCILTGGLLVVFCINYPAARMKFISFACGGGGADFVLIEEDGADDQFVPVEHYDISEGQYACFESCGVRYVASNDKNWIIEKLAAEPEDFTSRFVTRSDLANRPSRAYLRAVYGLNCMKIEAADSLIITLREIVSPFYLFQYFAVAVWLYTDYIVYSTIVMFITVMSIVFCVKGKIFNLKRLHDLAGQETPIIPYDLTSEVSGKAKVSDRTLVPGDCFVVTPGMTIPADAILIRGRVVIDESMLTGESVPVTKTEFRVSPSDHDATKRTANILYSGTTVKVVYQGTEAVAMTHKTGFRSARGELIAALITPKGEIVSFMPDAIFAILFMVIITTAIFGWSADEMKHHLNPVATDKEVVIAYLTALTIAVPPGLVACLSIGTSISVARLLLKNITITDTGKLTAAGYVSYACFDKTGTLTDENIVFQGTKLYSGGQPSTDVSVTQVANEVMATCHSLSILDGNKVVGDPLEVELFRATNWDLKMPMGGSQGSNMIAVPPSTQPNALMVHTILRQFEFSPEKLRAVTLMSRPDPSDKSSQQYTLLLKGSPEMILKMSDPATVPADIQLELTTLAKQGFRVLALAFRKCSEVTSVLMNASQHELETSASISFLGLVYFSNKLKPDTFPATIAQLQQANIHVNMITGDHYHTACAISTDCNILRKRGNLEGQLYLVDAAPSADGEMRIVISDMATETVIPDMTVPGLIEEYYNKLAYGSKTPSGDGDIENIMLVTQTNAGNWFQIIVTGVAFHCIQTNTPDLLEPLCRIVSVFARMKPADKKKVVTELMKPNSRLVAAQLNQQANSNNSVTALFTGAYKERECYVLFCGDGANDMEALSTATVGVSLCDTATTVAAAIVSTNQTPLAVVDVLKEGRCSLITAYVLVNFNIMYAIIQLFMTCFLNNLGFVFGDYMYLIQDLFYSLFLGLAIANTDCSDNLAVKLPPQTLFSRGLLVKLAAQIAIFPTFQAITLRILYAQSWFTPTELDDDSPSYCHEATALNIIALSQLMIASVVVTIGEPYRKPWYTNKSHVAVLLIHTSWIMYLMFGESNMFMVGIDNRTLPHDFCGILMGIIALNCVVSGFATKAADYFF